MEEQKKKNRVRLPLRAYLLYLLVVTFALTGVTFSRYVVSSNGGDAARVAAIRDLTVTETGDVPADGGRWLLAPGVELTKNAVVTLGFYLVVSEEPGQWIRPTNPKTGDRFPLGWYVGMMAVTGTALAVLGLGGRRRRSDEDEKGGQTGR